MRQLTKEALDNPIAGLDPAVLAFRKQFEQKSPLDSLVLSLYFAFLFVRVISPRRFVPALMKHTTSSMPLRWSMRYN